MRSATDSGSRSLRALRWQARAPRLFVFAALGVLCLGGVRAALAGPPEPPSAPVVPERHDQAAATFAEGFVRDYLTVDPRRPELRERRLGRYLSEALEPDAGLVFGGDRASSVQWSAVVGQSRRGPVVTVTVAAESDGELVHIAVPVSRDERGFMAVAGYPALVGAPAIDTRAEAVQEDEVEDPRLLAVAERAVTNYLAGERRNLLADLAPGALVSLPERALTVRSVDAVTWVRRPHRVAVELEATDEQQSSWTLRYELGVWRRERWYVRSLSVDPTQRGAPR